MPAFASTPADPPERTLLQDAYPATWLAAHLVSQADWSPHPRAAERSFWQGLPEDVRGRILAEGESALAAGPWPQLTATGILDYVRTGNRDRFQDPRQTRRERLRVLALAECVEHRGRFLDAVIDGLWLICEESSWCLPAHLPAQRAGPGLPDVAEPTVDLGAAETAADLALIRHLLEPELAAVSPLVTARIDREITNRILQPCLERDDWWWMGLRRERPVNNWNPWIVSNWLACLLVVEPDPARRGEAVAKALRMLDRFLSVYHDDGGCDEGPSYWGHAGGSLLECLDQLHAATRGALDVFAHPLFGEIGRYLPRVHLDGPWFVNFADASARPQVNGALVWRYGRALGDAELRAFGAAVWRRRGGFQPGFDALRRALPELRHLREIAAEPVAVPQPRDVWMPGLQVMVARDRAGTAEGFFVAAKGGHNAESHNHNDVGNFVLAIDGRLAVIDIGVGVYTAQTFGPRRYEIWTMQSTWHSLPTIRGVQQHEGRAYGARHVRHAADDRRVEFALDLAGAYPAEAGVHRWERSLALQRGVALTLTDRWELAEGGRLELSLPTPRRPDLVAPGRAVLRGLDGGPVADVLYDPALLIPEIDEHPTDDARLQPVWGAGVFRLRLVASEAAPRGEWVVRFTRPGP